MIFPASPPSLGKKCCVFYFYHFHSIKEMSIVLVDLGYRTHHSSCLKKASYVLGLSFLVPEIVTIAFPFGIQNIWILGCVIFKKSVGHMDCLEVGRLNKVVTPWVSGSGPIDESQLVFVMVPDSKPGLCLQTAPADGSNEHSVVWNMPADLWGKPWDTPNIGFFKYLKHVFMTAKCLFNVDMIECEYCVMLFLSWNWWTWSRSPYFKNTCYNPEHKPALKIVFSLAVSLTFLLFTPDTQLQFDCLYRRCCRISLCHYVTVNLALWVMCLALCLQWCFWNV